MVPLYIILPAGIGPVISLKWNGNRLPEYAIEFMRRLTTDILWGLKGYQKI